MWVGSNMGRKNSSMSTSDSSKTTIDACPIYNRLSRSKLWPKTLALAITVLISDSRKKLLSVQCLMSVRAHVLLFLFLSYLPSASSLWTTHMKLTPRSQMVTWPMTSRDPKRSNSWSHYLWGAISP